MPTAQAHTMAFDARLWAKRELSLLALRAVRFAACALRSAARCLCAFRNARIGARTGSVAHETTLPVRLKSPNVHLTAFNRPRTLRMISPSLIRRKSSQTCGAARGHGQVGASSPRARNPEPRGEAEAPRAP